MCHRVQQRTWRACAECSLVACWAYCECQGNLCEKQTKARSQGAHSAEGGSVLESDDSPWHHSVTDSLVQVWVMHRENREEHSSIQPVMAWLTSDAFFLICLFHAQENHDSSEHHQSNFITICNSFFFGEKKWKKNPQGRDLVLLFQKWLRITILNEIESIMACSSKSTAADAAEVGAAEMPSRLWLWPNRSPVQPSHSGPDYQEPAASGVVGFSDLNLFPWAMIYLPLGGSFSFT